MEEVKWIGFNAMIELLAVSVLIFNFIIASLIVMVLLWVCYRCVKAIYNTIKNIIYHII